MTWLQPVSLPLGKKAHFPLRVGSLISPIQPATMVLPLISLIAVQSPSHKGKTLIRAMGSVEMMNISVAVECNY